MSLSAIRAGRAEVELGIRDRLRKGLARATKRLKNFANSANQIGRSLGRVGLLTTAAFAPAVAIFSNFDDKMRAVRGVTQATAKDFELLTNKAKELGRTTSFTAGEVADLMAELGRAGFKPTQINTMTSAVLSLSKATGTEAASAAGIMAATIRQFGLQAGDAARVADTLTVAANGSFNSVTSLGDAMQYAGPVAADMNMSLEDTLAILGGLGNVGIQGSMAGSALRRLVTLTAADAERMQKIFGVAFTDAAGNARPLVQVMAEVNEKTKDLASGDRAKKFKDAFGLLGITAASSIGKAASSINDLKGKLDEAEGVSKKTADEMEAGLGGSFRKLISAAEGVAIAVGDSLAKPLAGLSSVLTEVSGFITQFVSKNQGLVKAIAATGLSLLVAGGLFLGLGSLAGLAAFATSGLSTAIAFAGGVVGLLGSAFAILNSPLGLAIAAIVAGTYAFFKFTKAGQSTLAWFSARFATLKDIVGDTFAGMSAAIDAGDLTLATKIAFTGVKLAVVTIMDEVLKIFGSSIQEMFKVLAELYKRIGTVIAKLNVLRVKAVNATSEALKNGYNFFVEQDIDVAPEQAAAIKAANQLFDRMEGLDVTGLGKSLRDAFGVDALAKELDQLEALADAAQQALEEPRLATSTVEKLVSAAKAVEEAQMQVSSAGTFSGAAASRLAGSTKLERETEQMKQYLRNIWEKMRKSDGLLFD